MTGFPWKAVAWDIDGTLVDSEPLHHKALVLACADHGLDISELDPREFLGVQMHAVFDSLASRLPPGLARSDFLEQVRVQYRACADDLLPIPGALEVIGRLGALGVVQVCVSNSEREVVDLNLARLGITQVLKGSISLSEVSRGKPDPEPYLRGAAMTGLNPAEVLAVEDSLTGTRSALAAGMQVALLWPDGAGHGLGPRVHPIAHLTRLLELR